MFWLTVTFVAKLYIPTDILILFSSMLKTKYIAIFESVVIFVRGQTEFYNIERNGKIIFKMFKNSLSFIPGVGRGLI